MTGQILMHLLFGVSIASFVGYLIGIKKGAAYITVARILYFTLAAGAFVAFCGVAANVMTHSFEYTYVWSYSNKELPPWFLMAASYAGQEGSFMLWTLWVSIIGVVLIPYLKRRGWEAEVMVFYSLIMVFLMLLLVAKNPFAFVWETFAKDGIPEGAAPPNGRGLNPLLHNLWITIHPPILFTGFAAMSVPFAFAMASLIKREYHGWIKVALPWTLYATAILGFGIMLGGFWAYETLGWGGYWAWDPVENSSLIPWLTSVALVHTMLVQSKTGGLVKTNIVLASLSFLLVLYSTFLTRSGVLGDTSVHSFVDPGMFAFVLLIVFMSVFAAITLGLVVARIRDIDTLSAPKYSKPQSREFALAIGAGLTLISAVIVFIGTSWPLISEILKQPKVAIDPSFYNKTHLPLMILVMIANGYSLLVRWKGGNWNGIGRQALIAGGVALALTATSWFAGVHEPLYVALSFAAWFALFINGDLLLSVARRKMLFTGAYISHLGIAMLVLGIISTSRYTELTHARLVQGKPQQALGYQLTFLGRQQIEHEFTDREKFRFLIEVVKDGRRDTIAPILFWSDFNKRQSAFLEPGIKWGVTKDLYVSPKSTEVEGGLPKATLSKDSLIVAPIGDGMTMRFLSFDMSNMAKGPQDGKIRPGAVVEVGRGDSLAQYTIYSKMDMQTMEVAAEPFTIPGTSLQIAFSKLVAEKGNLQNSKAEFSFADLSKPETFPKEVFSVEVSIKPLINLVWFGVIFMVVGFFVSIFRHRKDFLETLTKREQKSSIAEPAALVPPEA